MADYKVTDTELTSIANAIRAKGGTQAQLEFPTGFVSAVNAIPTGGGSNYSDILNFEQGTVVSATSSDKTNILYPNMKASSNTRIRSQTLFPIIVGATYALYFNDDVYDVCLQPFNWDAGAWGAQPDANVYNVWKGSFSFMGRGGYIAIVIRRKDGADITPSEFSSIAFTIAIEK